MFAEGIKQEDVIGIIDSYLSKRLVFGDKGETKNKIIMGVIKYFDDNNIKNITDEVISDVLKKLYKFTEVEEESYELGDYDIKKNTENAVNYIKKIIDVSNYSNTDKKILTTELIDLVEEDIFNGVEITFGSVLFLFELLESDLKQSKEVKAKKEPILQQKEGSGMRRVKPNSYIDSNLGFVHKKIKIGRGLNPDDKPKFIQFGKYLLNQPHLYNDSKLTLRFPSGGAIPQFKPSIITEDFREFLIDLIENEKMSQPLYKSLNDKEKKFFEKICKGAGLVHKFNIKPSNLTDDIEQKELNRYKLLVGEVEAGNNNKDLIKELRALVIKFSKDGRMGKADSIYMLTELSSL
jgi:hypothetical protein